MPDISTVAPGALDRFVLDLVEAGFATTEGCFWTGPLDPSLAGLTTATTMTFVIDHGWPYRHPHLLVEGLRPSVHLNGAALCLWRVGDASLAWLRLDELRARIAEWAERYRGRATLDDPVLDAHLYWRPIETEIMATVDLSAVRWGDGGSGALSAKVDGRVLSIGNEGDLRVRWYGRHDMRHPPVNMGMITDGLKTSQARDLQRELERVGQPGGLDVLMLVWNTPVGEPNLLVLRLDRDEAGAVQGKAMEVARTDEEVLIRRAGPDAAALRARSVVIFGQGAIGSNLSLLLARSGVGKLTIVDGQRLRPGDRVRHAGTNVGYSKVVVTSVEISDPAPWTEVVPLIESEWDPRVIRRRCAGADLVIDAVGEASYTEQLSRVSVEEEEPLLSIALFRGGAVARARLQMPGGVPFHERADSASFPTIPPGPREVAPTWETGCAAPVNNAPPTAVMSAAALAARLAVEVLMGRERGNFDVVEIYRRLEAAPFDEVGYRRYDG